MGRPPHRAALLIVLDGFAWGKKGHPCNAVELAATPTFDRLRATCPHTELKNNGPDVGLPPGQMGNSEVGHLNIGAGRIVYQDLMRINNDIAAGTLGRNAAIAEAFARARRPGASLHLMGLLGPGGVHAHENHWGAMLSAAAAAGVKDVWLHPVGDGRDTPPQSAVGFAKTLARQMESAGIGKVADFVGRYWAMDRDQRWERIQTAYEVYAGDVRGGTRTADGASASHSVGAASATRAGEAPTKPRTARDLEDALRQAAAAGEGDEFVQPTVIDPKGAVRDGDAVIWLNFRPDRSRQMTRAFMDPAFTGFRRAARRDLLWVCMTQYDAGFAAWPGVRVAYAPQAIAKCLAQHVSDLGLTQFHIAETEKYAHVTYFLNGGREAPFPGEERLLVPSPKVATYDLQPEMSAGEVTDRLLQAMGSGGHDLYVVNFANPDMVGHTGKLRPTIEAVAFIDQCIHRLTSVATGLGLVTLITSDHGNAEDMCKLNADGTAGEPITKHTMYPSPLIAVNAGKGVSLRDGGRLENVSPTLLDLMGLSIPSEMTAKSLVQR